MKILSAEFLKLKGTYTYFLPLVIVCFSCAVVGAAQVLDAHFSIKLGRNPWEQLTHGGLVVYTTMLYTPFIILLVAAVYYVEQRANALKLLFVQPTDRSLQYLNKILMLILLTAGTSLLMLLGLVLTGYFVDFWLPEFGFVYSSPEWKRMSRILLHSAISGLGVLGVQHLISLRFSNILVAPGIGIMGFILAFILAATGSRFALYLPYSYPMLIQDLETFPFEHQTFPIAGVSNTELLSIGWFLVCIGLGYVFNKNRNVY